MDLNELKAQREAVASHLKWLDQQIARIQGGDSTTFERSLADSGIELEPTLSSEPSDVRPRSISALKNGLSSTERLGCAAILAVAAILFLTALFVLPFYIYK